MAETAQPTITIGAEMFWAYVPRGGYGWPTEVDALVLRIGPSRVRVQVKKRSGEFVERTVRAESLYPRKEG
jgi:hypothetical protein